jgi:hypothetical protein
MVDVSGVRAMLAKSRRLILVSRNLARLLTRRIDLARGPNRHTPESVRARSGRNLAQGSAGSGSY